MAPEKPPFQIWPSAFDLFDLFDLSTRSTRSIFFVRPSTFDLSTVRPVRSFSTFRPIQPIDLFDLRPSTCPLNQPFDLFDPSIFWPICPFIVLFFALLLPVWGIVKQISLKVYCPLVVSHSEFETVNEQRDTLTSAEPLTFQDAMDDPLYGKQWEKAINEEYIMPWLKQFLDSCRQVAQWKEVHNMEMGLQA